MQDLKEMLMHYQLHYHDFSCNIIIVNNMFDSKHPIKGHAYAVVTGDYVGEMFIYVESVNNAYNFISIPKNINRTVPKDKFEFGITNNIVDPVTKLDKNVFKLLHKQYEYNYKHASNTK